MPALKAIHIAESHKPTLDPNSAKSMALPTHSRTEKHENLTRPKKT